MRARDSSFVSWKQAVGPLATLACALVISILFQFVTTAPIAAPIFLWAVVLSAYHGGIASGLASCLIAIAFGAVYLSEPGQLFHYSANGLARFVTLAVDAR